MNQSHNVLRILRARVDTYQQPIVFMRSDCHVCSSEGFSALTRVRIACGARSVVATLNVVHDEDWIPHGTALLSEAAWKALAPSENATAAFTHPDPPQSASALRAKVFGIKLVQDEFLSIIRDALAGNLSDLELAAFVTACAGDRLDLDETIALTKAMLAVGERIDWGAGYVLDKHCVGGLPGNRTTPIVVAIIAAAGKRIPKTSSRAITSPAGTADTMETMAPVSLNLAAMRKVVEKEGGCVVWGGHVRLSPADDVLVRVERPLDFDSAGQLVASVLSKKAAAGSSHVLIDIPVGPTAKIRTDSSASALSGRLAATAEVLGLQLRVVMTDGIQPVGFGIGPALEARDVLAVLRGEPFAPGDLRERAVLLAGALLDMAPDGNGTGKMRAHQLLDSGEALAKFIAICDAQGGFREPGAAAYRFPFPASTTGKVASIDNRRLAKVAKLAGAPSNAEAGVFCRLKVGDRVDIGDRLFEICANTLGALDYALEFAAAHDGIVEVRDEE